MTGKTSLQIFSSGKKRFFSAVVELSSQKLPGSLAILLLPHRLWLAELQTICFAEYLAGNLCLESTQEAWYAVEGMI